MIPVLRFRDLNVPTGETIRRHAEIARRNGYVYWGWMKRNREQVPWNEFKDLAEACNIAPQSVLLFDSGREVLFDAKLRGIHVFPGGENSPAPQPRMTPPYMAEASLPAWFKLGEISNEPNNLNQLTIIAQPTLGDIDAKNRLFTMNDLRADDATFWIAKNNLSGISNG